MEIMSGREPSYFGKSKVALNKIPLFSQALNLDEAELFNMALKEHVLKCLNY